MENISDLINAADSAYYLEDYTKAESLYKQVLEIDTNNKHASEKIRKIEINRLAKTTKPMKFPPDAVKLFKRSRSFITAGDLVNAKDLLQQAVLISEKKGVDFPEAKYLLKNIEDALKAEEYKKTAFEALEGKLWLKADANLSKAIELDPINKNLVVLLEHLRNLLKAQRLISLLDAGTEKAQKSKEMILEIRTIIERTNEISTLSALWQEVVRLFGSYNDKGALFPNRKTFLRGLLLIIASVCAIILIAFYFIYLKPYHRSVEMACENVSPGLRVEMDYPYYLSSYDNGEIEINFENEGKDMQIEKEVVVGFTGSANLKYSDKSKSNIIVINKLKYDQNQQEVIPFRIEGIKGPIPGPWYLNFSIAECSSSVFHIAMSPIPRFGKIIGGLWGVISLAFAAVFSEQIRAFFAWMASFIRNG